MLLRSYQSYGVPVIRFYDLRHSAATLRLVAGENPKIVRHLTAASLGAAWE
jgi:hypothetical protein